MSLLRDTRERRVLTQAALAAISGVTISTISRIETERMRPEMRTIQALAQALNIEPEALAALRQIGRVGRANVTAENPKEEDDA
jgi:transcriptional regulator with XRE-family HTH domain